MADRRLDELIDKLVTRLSLEQKTRLLSGDTAWTTHAEPAIGLRAIVMSDGPVGLRGTTGGLGDASVCTPSPTALAASWDPELAREVGGLLAAEARRKAVDVLLAPTINLHRTPFGGRHFECFSEDPYLTAEIGQAYVDGLQSSGVAATIKHYVANDSETDRFTYEAVIDERPLRELYLRPFEDIIATAHPWLVMAAYNAVNGPTMTENPLLSAPLNSEWNFDGLVVSDWKAVRSTAESAQAGTDLAMPGPKTRWSDDKLAAAVRRGEVDESAVDEKVRRLLRLAARVGALEGANAPAPVTSPDTADAPGLLRRAAAAGMVLVRNDGILPLDPASLRRVAVIGPNAEQVCVRGGGSARVEPAYVITPLQGLAAALEGHAEIVHAPGVLPDGAPDDEIARAAALAATADVAIMIVGTSDSIESEGFDRTTLALPDRQAELVEAVLRSNPRTVVVVNSGAPVELPWLDEAPATLLVWFPGQEAGHALADVLTGAREPGGRMPTTWPQHTGDRPLPSPVPADGKLRYAEGLHIGYRAWLRSGAEPALPFGSGLGYTTWRFDTLVMHAAADGADATARVTLTNTGPRHGTQTVQVYLSRPDSAVERPARWLGGFARVTAAPGDTVTVDVTVTRRQFAHWSPADHRWTCEPGTFVVLAGDSAASVPLRSTWEITQR
jgi:beta-glucosidase